MRRLYALHEPVYNVIMTATKIRTSTRLAVIDTFHRLDEEYSTTTDNYVGVIGTDIAMRHGNDVTVALVNEILDDLVTAGLALRTRRHTDKGLALYRRPGS